MFTALLAIVIGAVMGGALGCLLSFQHPGQNPLQWAGAGAAAGAAGFWLLQAVLKFVLRSLCWIGLGGLAGAGIGLAVLRVWPACPVTALPHWLALAGAAALLLRAWVKDD